MKTLRIVFAVLLLVAILTGGYLWYGRTAPNPDPNHTHADFAVWVNGTRLDFSGENYMSGSATDETHDGAHHQYLHLHDANGHVLHSHKPGQTFGEFLASIGLTMTTDCVTLDAAQFASLDEGWVQDFARTPELCDDGKFRWTFVVNGETVPMNPGYAFQDEDQLLLSYGASDTAVSDQWKEMTGDSCLYSRTCPGRGDPPTENCIADPTIPCVVP